MVVISFILLALTNVYAWGPKGQTITVAVAETFLTPAAQKQVREIVKNQKLSDLATWADQARSSSEWTQTATWHYVNVDSDGAYERGAGHEADDIVEAINLCVTKLSSSLSNEEKLVWLKFLVHFVGDLHQPMHVGKPEDRGGNSVRVTYRRELNLHALWDSSFIEEQSLTVDGYLKRLISQNQDTSELVKPFSADRVIVENFKMREFLYSFKNNTIDPAYAKKAVTVTEDRLWKGGVRLASILNTIFR